MDRRTFAGTVASALLVRSFRASGQPAKKAPLIGVLHPSTAASTSHHVEAFKQGLRERGYVEGQNIVVERRFGDGKTERIAEFAAELVRMKVDVIVTTTDGGITAVRQQTETIPIVMASSTDPVGTGFVASLARPGGNVTGLSFVGTEVAGKQVDLLREAVKGLASIAVLANPMNPSHPPRVKTVLATARTLKLRVDVAEVSTRDEISEALRAIGKRGTGAALVLADPLFVREASSIIQLAAEQRLPVMYGLREAAVAGGFMSYGPSFTEQFRRAAAYVDKILKGAKPADLPIEQPTKFELVVNVTAAKALGLTVPPSLLLRAYQVIEP